MSLEVKQLRNLIAPVVAVWGVVLTVTDSNIVVGVSGKTRTFARTFAVAHGERVIVEGDTVRLPDTVRRTVYDV